jgi:hypothetical protein
MRASLGLHPDSIYKKVEVGVEEVDDFEGLDLIDEMITAGGPTPGAPLVQLEVEEADERN